MASGTVAVVALSDIRENVVALRPVDKTKDPFKDLVESIKARGVINPISVVPDKEPGKFVLIDGLHRYTAAIEAGLTQIPVHVLDISEREVLETQIEANLQKIETRPIHYTRQLQRIMARNPERTLEEQARRLHKSPAWLKERLALTKLTEELAGLVDEGKITISNAYVLTRIPAEEQADWAERAATLPPDQFVPMALQRAKEVKAERKGEKVEETGPAARLRKLGDIKGEFERSQQLGSMAKDPKEKGYVEGYQAALAWILQLDKASVKAWEQEQQELAAEKKRRAEAKAAEKVAKDGTGAAPTLSELLSPPPEKKKTTAGAVETVKA